MMPVSNRIYPLYPSIFCYSILMDSFPHYRFSKDNDGETILARGKINMKGFYSKIRTLTALALFCPFEHQTIQSMRKYGWQRWEKRKQKTLVHDRYLPWSHAKFNRCACLPCAPLLHLYCPLALCQLNHGMRIGPNHTHSLTHSHTELLKEMLSHTEF